MSRRRIDHHQVLDVLRQVASEFPDRVDHRSGLRRARYVEHGEPHCLVAVVMARLGTPVGQIAELDRQRPDGTVRIDTSNHPAVRRFTPVARELLGRVQRLQDSGVPWGEAVARVTNPHSYRNCSWLGGRR